ncbi:MAG: glycosyl hydrolase [Pseudolysinimonas sp.]
MADIGRPEVRLTAAIAALAVAVTVGLSGCVTTEHDGGAEVLAADRLAPLVAALPDRPASPSTIPRPADSPAPTNRWYSGMVFGDGMNPVFPMPLSFQLVSGGFAFGVPDVAAGGTGVGAPAVADMTVTTHTDSVQLVRSDDVSVTVALVNGGQPQGEVTIARGSPIVSYRVIVDTAVSLSEPMSPDGGTAVVDVAGQRFAMIAPDGALSSDGTTVSLDAGATVRWFPIPEGGDVAKIAASAGPVSGVVTSFDVGDDATTTHLRYETGSDEPTLIAVTPQQMAGRDEADGMACDLGEFTTLLGVLELCSGSTLGWSTPRVDPAGTLQLDDISDSERDELRAAVIDDVAGTTFAEDSYFGGKSLARAADLLVLAEQVGADDAAAELRERLSEELRTWTDPSGCDTRATKCFSYDSETGGVVGQEPAFGSEEFNDHHFHYGYFLYAAALVAADDSALRDDIAPVMTVLAADLASGSASELFPLRRTFDPYSGHSWASGPAPFADGNNQESSSEAVAAWNGLGLWAEVTDDAPLAREATWMLSSEAFAARTGWVGFDPDATPYEDYGHDVVGIVWDGKIDYATWFSAEPAAILGIQLIPMGAVSGYLAGDPDRIRRNVAEALERGPAPQFADLILMYQALAGPEDASAALDAARELPDAAIDDGNSRSHLLAFIMSHAG